MVFEALFFIVKRSLRNILQTSFQLGAERNISDVESRLYFLQLCIDGCRAIGTAAQAKAADLGSFFGGQQQEQDADAPTQPVEFGTGWYIRGSVGGAVQAMPDLLSDPNNVGFTQKLNWFVEAGAGYQINQWFRTDATYTYYGSQPVNGYGTINCITSLSPIDDQATGDVIATGVNTNVCSTKESTSVQKNLFLANGYVDLGTYWGVTPYIGAGVGTAYLNASQTVNVFNPDGTPYRANLVFPNPSSVPARFTNPQTGALLNPQPHINSGVQNLGLFGIDLEMEFRLRTDGRLFL